MTNFHRLISLFVRLLFLGYCVCYSSIVSLFIYCILQDTPRTKRRASKLVIDSSDTTNNLFFPVTCCSFVVVDEFLFVVFDVDTYRVAFKFLPEFNSLDE